MIQPNKILVIAPHPDDETLGAGGTIVKLSKLGAKVSILFVSGHMPPLYTEKEYKLIKNESHKALKILGVKNCQFLDIPATKVHEIPISELNKKIKDYLDQIKPDTVLIPFADRHIDHRTIFDSSMVACRPTGKHFPSTVLAYETLSETHWNAPYVEANFVPDLFFNIDNAIDTKISALRKYKSQINNKAPSRSLDAVKALARFRGSQNGCKYAEGFKVLRIIL